MIDSENSMKANTLWFHVYGDFVSSGRLAEMPGSALKTYVALKSHINLNSGVARISLKTLVVETGTSRETVKRSISKLVELGHIKSSLSAGHTSSYICYEHFNIRKSNGNLIGVATFTYSGSAAGRIQKELSDTLSKGQIDTSSKHIRYELNEDKTTIGGRIVDISSLPDSLQKKLGPHLYRASKNTKK